MSRGLRVGARIGGDLEVLEEVGRGTYGQVVRARDHRLGREVAVKVLLGGGVDPRARERLAREARILAEFPHAALVELLGAELDHDPPYLVFPWMAGGDLRAVHVRGEVLPLHEVLHIGARLARALAHLHARGVLHRDLKPANVLRDGTGEVFLADVGLGSLEGAPRLTASAVAVGTLLYLAPEVLEGDGHSPASDLFALGGVLLELALGEPADRPFSEIGPTQDRVRRVGSPELRKVLLGCLASNPARRSSDAAEVARALEDCRARVQSELSFPGAPAPPGARSQMLATVSASAPSDRPPPARPGGFPVAPVAGLVLGVVARLAVGGGGAPAPPARVPAPADAAWESLPLGVPAPPPAWARAAYAPGEVLRGARTGSGRALIVRAGEGGGLAIEARTRGEAGARVLAELPAPPGARLVPEEFLARGDGRYLLVTREERRGLGPRRRVWTGSAEEAPRGVDAGGGSLEVLGLLEEGTVLRLGGEFVWIARDGGHAIRWSVPGGRAYGPGGVARGGRLYLATPDGRAIRIP